MRRVLLLATLVTLTTIICAPATGAAPIQREELPPQLTDWIPWVLDEFPEHGCVQTESSSVCVWPGELTLDLDGDGGRFTQRVTCDADDMTFTLPGNAAHWPQEVTLDRRPATVLDVDGTPAMVLGKGTWEISGRMYWNEMPEGIRIPPRTALVSLSLAGEPVPYPRRDEDGLLWLQSATTDGEEGDRLDLEVYRKIADAIPIIVTTRLVVRVSGKSREMDLGPALLDGTTVVKVDADIPARVDKDGHLRLQVRAGTHKVEISARTDGPVGKLASSRRSEPWPAEEIWVWQANEVLRQVSVSGAPGIDPSRTNMPKEWNGMSAFLIAPDATLELTETRRGELNPPPDQLSLSRELWMDLDGDGFTVRDRLSGELNQTWRLDLDSGGKLGHVQVGGVDQLITRNPETKKPGVELRKGNLEMTAEWRLEDGGSELPAVGWTEDVQSLDATLHLPPGRTLLYAGGVDDLPGTWVDEWDLFAFFFVLLVSIGIGWLTRFYWGIVSLFTLVLLHQQAELGIVVFISISLLVFLGLLKVLPWGRLHLAARICWWVTVLILVLALIPFSVHHLRAGIYPQIDEGGAYNDFDVMPNLVLAAPMATAKDTSIEWELEKAEEVVDEENFGGEGIAGGAPMEPPGAKGDDFKAGPKKKRKMALQEQVQMDGRNASRVLDGLGYGASSGSVSSKLSGKKGNLWRKSLQQDPKAIVQTGPGVPTWSWRSWNLNWSGPVDKEHKIELVTLGQTAHMILSFLRILLLVLLSAVIIRRAMAIIRLKRDGGAPSGDPGKSAPPAKAAKAAAATALLLCTLAPAIASGAEEPIPDRQILDDLGERLTRNPDCWPDCVSTSSLAVEIDDSTLTLTAQVNAGDDASWLLPGPANNWVPESVTVDRKGTSSMALLDDGFLHVRLGEGPHTVVASGPAPPNDAVTLEFGQLPHRVTVEAPGWSVDGIREDGRADTSIQLNRTRTEEGDGDAPEFDENAYPPWLEITRTLDLGIPWLVHTSVKRVSPTGSPVMTRIPLLKGESVTESELQVEEGHVILSMGRDDTEVRWSSTLEEQPEMELVAPEGKPWTEVWVLSSSPIWKCEHDGIPPIKHKSGGKLEPRFRPWPGEKLSLKATRPSGVEGQSVTIDSAMLTVSPGIRLITADLELSIRSSQGGVQKITLPQKAEIQSLTVNGAERPVRQEGRTLEITLSPGSQEIEVSWQQPGGIVFKTVVPKVDLGGPAANVRTIVNLPDDRWLLNTSGPDWGPAILFWGYLLAILIGGFILGMLKLSPLRWWQWMLLGLGLTQVPAPVALIIISWFFVLAWRKRKPPAHFFWHNSLQIVIGIWTLVALICMFVAVYSGLAVQPDMQVAGTGSSNSHLVWYTDRIDGAMPTPIVFSLHSMIWKATMLVWSLWLAASLVMWARWGWKAFSHEVLWRSIPRHSVAPQAPAPTVEEKPAKEEEPPEDEDPPTGEKTEPTED